MKGPGIVVVSGASAAIGRAVARRFGEARWRVVIPGLLDRLLARTGYSGQHTDDPLPPGRRDNLYEPVPGDHGAHGRFDAQARPRSLQLEVNMHRGAIAAGALAAGLAALVGWTWRRRLS